jgi:hypothetical protein
MSAPLIGAALLLLLPFRSACAQEVLTREGQVETPDATMVVPFAFYSSSAGFSGGLSVGRRGWLQPQAALFGTAIGSVDGTVYGFLAIRDIRVPWNDRLYIDAQFNVGKFSELDIFTEGNPDFPDQKAGSHDSDKDNFITGDGTDNAGWVRLLYVLPLGAGREDPESRLVLRDGIVVEGARDTSSWNPFRNGYSILGVKPFFRTQDLEFEEIEDRESSTVGAEFIFHYHNTDFAVNPSKGGFIQMRYTRDWGELDSTAEWETVDALATKYFSFGEGRRSRQRVLALSAWLIDTPSWDDSNSEDGEQVLHRPPSFAGASLGGLARMKGYAEGRFSDRAAAYYTAEYRHIPKWNPLADSAWLRSLNADVDWLQYVVGVEVGRVADEFDLGELHSDMKIGGTFGVRAMINHLVVRADVGIADEGVGVQMTIDHPF